MTDLFRNTHDALTFAFNYQIQQYALSPMSKLMRGAALGGGKGLVSIDGAAQSGMIHSALEQLTPLERHCLVARWSPKYEDCPCCGSLKPLQDWKESITALRDWSMCALTGMSHATVREAIILNFFSRGVSVAAAAKLANVPERTATRHRSLIHAQLKLLDAAAQVKISDLLADRRIVDRRT